MKFAIRDVLWTTTAAALLLAILRYSADGFILVFALLNLLQVAIPVGILLATIAFAEQRGPMLDASSLPGWRLLKKIWILSILCTVVVWALLPWCVGSRFIR